MMDIAVTDKFYLIHAYVRPKVPMFFERIIGHNLDKIEAISRKSLTQR
jgi:hypothetical protein